MASVESGVRGGQRGGSLAAGFTLVEVVVAVSLVSVILLGMISAMRTLGGTATRVDALVERSEQMRATSEFLRASLDVIQPPPSPVGGVETARPSLWGGPERFEWVGLIPARFGAGGMHRFLLEFDGRTQPGSVRIHFAPRLRGPQAPEWDAIAPAVSIDHVDRLLVRYQGDDDGWLEAWDDSDKLPRRVLLRLWVDGRAWPDIIVTPSAEGGAGPGEEIVHGPVR